MTSSNWKFEYLSGKHIDTQSFPTIKGVSSDGKELRVAVFENSGGLLRLTVDSDAPAEVELVINRKNVERHRLP